MIGAKTADNANQDACRIKRSGRKVAYYFLCSMLITSAFGCNAAQDNPVQGQVKSAHNNELYRDLSSKNLTADRFTEIYAARVEESTGAKVRIIRPLELSVKFKDGSDLTAFLQNAWAQAQNNPDDRLETLERYLATTIDLRNRGKEDPSESKVDRTKIVPLIRHKEYIDNTLVMMEDRPIALVFERLDDTDLYIVYGIDEPNGVALLTDDQLKKLKIEKADLRKASLGNLGSMTKKLAIVSKEGVSAIELDGNYESSMLLATPVWNHRAKQFDDDIVAAVPSRSVVLFAARKDAAGIDKVKALAKEIFDGGDHVISNALYLWKDQKWQVYKP